MGSEVNFPGKTGRINWRTSVPLALLHVGAVAAFFVFQWQALIVAVLLYWMAIGWGIGMGYHRLLTHRSYEAPKLFEYFLAICGTLTLQGGPIAWVGTHHGLSPIAHSPFLRGAQALRVFPGICGTLTLQGGPIAWVGTHRIHHQHSDKDADPHSPHEGGWWAHVGWIIAGEGNYNNAKQRRVLRYAPDLARDRFYVVLDKYHYVPLIVLGLILLAAGGIPMMLWGLCVRVVVGLHATWLVNSAAHMWGRRRFSTSDDSRNNWWVALLTFGEGWHNNHHAYPTSARHGLRWYEIDLTWMQIWFLQLLGLVKSAKVPKAAFPAMRDETA